MKSVPVDPINPSPDLIEKAAGIIRKGGLVVFPTTCLYGLGSDALNPEAVEKIFQIKQRSHQNPILILISRLDDLAQLVRNIPEYAGKIIKKFWPGMVTIVFEADEKLPDVLTAGTGKIGIRLCDHPVAAALVKATGFPITGTSANLSGNVGCEHPDQLEIEVKAKVDLILDAGKLQGGVGSTVVDVTGNEPKILRQGIVPGFDILSILDRT